MKVEWFSKRIDFGKPTDRTPFHLFLKNETIIFVVHSGLRLFNNYQRRELHDQGCRTSSA
jgi:hypothetical protein